jgi:uncharacterized membrane protein affecting hemolysin expression
MTGILLIVAIAALLICLVLLAPSWLFDSSEREARRVSQEEFLAQWQIRQVIRQAQQQMREAARRHQP